MQHEINELLKVMCKTVGRIAESTAIPLERSSTFLTNFHTGKLLIKYLTIHNLTINAIVEINKEMTNTVLGPHSANFKRQ